MASESKKQKLSKQAPKPVKEQSSVIQSVESAQPDAVSKKVHQKRGGKKEKPLDLDQLVPVVEKNPVNVESVVSGVNEATPSENVEDAKQQRRNSRREISRVTLETEFDSILSGIKTESAGKSPNTRKTFKQFEKRIKTLKLDALRISKQRVKNTRPSNSSGFHKPVAISKEMARFTGLSDKELHSRNEITKYICNYIQVHNLQNPSDRREIIPDRALADILKYDSKTEEKPLTYYYLQSKMKPHFIKQTEA